MTDNRLIGRVGCFVLFTLVQANSFLLAEERLADAESNFLDEFALSNDAPLLPVTLNDKTYSFMLDTGASCTVFDTSFVEHLGRPIRRRKVATLGNTITVPEFAMPDLQVGRLKPPPDARVLCASVLEARQALDEPLDGIIGMDFMRPYIVQLDFDAQMVRFLKSVPPEPGDRFPIGFDSSQLPQFKVKVTTAAADFTIDTGFTGTLKVRSQLFDELDNAGRIGIRSNAMFATAGGTYSQLKGRLDSLTLGQFTHRDMILDRHSRKNTIGIGYLKRFLVTFDFPQKVMYLKPGKGYDQADVWDLSGLHIWRVNGEALIDRVDSGSPAASLGVQPKDVITNVNDQPAPAVPLRSLRAMLRDTTRTVEITIRRAETTTSVELKPREFRMKPGSTVETSQSDRDR